MLSPLRNFQLASGPVGRSVHGFFIANRVERARRVCERRRMSSARSDYTLKLFRRPVAILMSIGPRRQTCLRVVKVLQHGNKAPINTNRSPIEYPQVCTRSIYHDISHRREEDGRLESLLDSFPFDFEVSLRD